LSFVVEARDLVKCYGNVEALKGLDLSVGRSESREHSESALKGVSKHVRRF